MLAVIKQGQPGRLLPRAAGLDLNDHLVEAQRLVERAGKKAEECIASAKREALAIQDKARRDGFAEGHESGFARGHEEGAAEGLKQATEEFRESQRDLVRSLQRVIDAFEGVHEELEIYARRDVLELALEIARRITGAIVEIDQGVAGRQVVEALRTVGELTDVHIRLHPHDSETARRFAESTFDELQKNVHVRWVDDSSVGRGGAVVMTNATQVDARITSQIEQVVEGLLGNAPSRLSYAVRSGKSGMNAPGDA